MRMRTRRIKRVTKCVNTDVMEIKGTESRCRVYKMR